MKRLLSSLLLIVFLFNVLGYYGVFVGLKVAHRLQMVKKFDAEQYQTSETRTFKIPLTIPYYSDSRDFERVDGEFVHKGEVYRLVKQRLHKDTLHIVCVRDVNSKKINQALADYVKTFTDKPVQGKDNTKASQSLVKDYISSSISLTHGVAGWERTLPVGAQTPASTNDYIHSIAHPPARA